MFHNYDSNSDLSSKQSYIGMICSMPDVQQNSNHLYPWMIRAFVLQKELIKHNYHIFCYFPYQIDEKNKKATGYILDKGRFKKKTLSIPNINYIYYSDEIDRDVLTHLEDWFLKNKRHLFPDQALNDILSNKHLIANFLTQHGSIIIPKTMEFRFDEVTLDIFLKSNSVAIIKPNKIYLQNELFIVKKYDNTYMLSYYKHEKYESSTYKSLSECLDEIKMKKTYQNYVIQEGFSYITYQGYYFKFRAIVFKIDNNFKYLTETYASISESLLFDMTLKEKSHQTEDVIMLLFDKTKGGKILDFLKLKSIELSTWLNQEIDNQANELAFDFSISPKGELILIDIKLNPDLIGSSENYDHFFLMSDKELNRYQSLTAKHGEYLAQLLMSKAMLYDPK